MDSPLHPPILIDDREQAGGLPQALRRCGLTPEVRRLALGDVALGERMLIERKTAADLAASLADGRLADQMTRLCAERDRSGRQVVLLLEGTLATAAMPGVDLEPLRQALLSIQLDWRVPVVATAGPDESARWIASMARRLASGVAPLGGQFRPEPKSSMGQPHLLRRRSPPVTSPGDVQRAALAAVPGLGPAKAGALLERFGALPALRAAGEAAWATVPGIGPEAVRALRRFFRDR